MKAQIKILQNDAVQLLQSLIAIPSLSRQEEGTATRIAAFLEEKNISMHRNGNNVWAVNKFYDASKPTILLNSHHDTVAPNVKYTRNPFLPKIEDGKLYGLGSTDAGASLVCLLAAFQYFYYKENMAYNILFAATAEEEISGANGIEKLFASQDFVNYFLHKDSVAIVGEPTELQLAIAEKGLLVLDSVAYGKAGHAAREEGENAIYKAIKAIDWFQQYRFSKISEQLGEIKMTVTSIYSENKAHNVVPAICSFVVDIRVTDAYTHEEIVEEIKRNVDVEIKPRSMRLRASSISNGHPIVQAAVSLGKTIYGSPTTSDQALIPLPSVKCGPGFSGQSHSADEFVELKWIEEAIVFYIEWLEKMN